MRVSLSDLQYYNLTSIPLADGSGYAAELGVFHELHCLVGPFTISCIPRGPFLITYIEKNKALDLQRILSRK